MKNKDTLYSKMSKICDNIMKCDPFKYFKKLATIGKGGFGEVLLVEHLKSRRHFAMKMIKPEDESEGGKDGKGKQQRDVMEDLALILG